ncbi:hypothetical protein FRC17_006920 [Serendipita sp. 399]|nr:hypothetical protein FRC17_006920 [Serendipita sp. 399]
MQPTIQQILECAEERNRRGSEPKPVPAISRRLLKPDALQDLRDDLKTIKMLAPYFKLATNLLATLKGVPVLDRLQAVVGRLRKAIRRVILLLLNAHALAKGVYHVHPWLAPKPDAFDIKLVTHDMYSVFWAKRNRISTIQHAQMTVKYTRTAEKALRKEVMPLVSVVEQELSRLAKLIDLHYKEKDITHRIPRLINDLRVRQRRLTPTQIEDVQNVALDLQKGFSLLKCLPGLIKHMDTHFEKIFFAVRKHGFEFANCMCGDDYRFLYMDRWRCHGAFTDMETEWCKIYHYFTLGSTTTVIEG